MLDLDNVIPILPIYFSPPNKFLRYEERKNNKYTERVAIYLNKKKEQCEMTAQIIWDEE